MGAQQSITKPAPPTSESGNKEPGTLNSPTSPVTNIEEVTTLLAEQNSASIKKEVFKESIDNAQKKLDDLDKKLVIIFKNPAIRAIFAKALSDMPKHKLLILLEGFADNDQDKILESDDNPDEAKINTFLGSLHNADINKLASFVANFWENTSPELKDTVTKLVDEQGNLDPGTAMSIAKHAHKVVTAATKGERLPTSPAGTGAAGTGAAGTGAAGTGAGTGAAVKTVKNTNQAGGAKRKCKKCKKCIKSTRSKSNRRKCNKYKKCRKSIRRKSIRRKTRRKSNRRNLNKLK